MVFRQDYENNDNADSHDELSDDGRNRLVRQRKLKVITTKAILRWTAMMLTTMMLIHMMMIIIACYYDDESYCFRYQIMRNCWQEEPDDRPSFEKLRRELKLMENQHKVI